MVALSSRQKAALTGGLAVLILFGYWWNSLASIVTTNAQAHLIAKINERINGKVSADSIDFSLLGTLTAHAVTVRDRQNAVIGKINQVSIRFGVLDALAGRTDMSAVKSVTLENPVMTLVAEADDRWNWQNLIKSNQEEPMTLRGILNVRDGMLLVGGEGQNKLDGINGNIDLARYPTLIFDLTAKSNNMPLAIKGNWNPGSDGELSIKADQIALADLPLSRFGAGDVRLTGGLVKNVLATVKLQDGRLIPSGEGDLESAATNVAGYTVNEGTAKVRLTDGKIELKDGAALLNGQKITLNGTLTLSDTGLQVNLDVASTAFDAAALGAMPLTGTLGFQAQVTGTGLQPQANGTFNIPQGSFGTITFTDGHGSFAYADTVLSLSETQATAWNGGLTIDGTVVPTTQEYHMEASGSGMDAGLLTEKDIKGQVSFDARLSGQGPSGGYAEGSFRMGEGSFQGIPFLSLTGDFVKQGENMRFSNIIVNTVGGSFQAEGVGEGSIVRIKQLDPGATPREVLEKVISNKVPDQLKKFLPGR